MLFDLTVIQSLFLKEALKELSDNNALTEYFGSHRISRTSLPRIVHCSASAIHLQSDPCLQKNMGFNRIDL